MEGEFFMKGMQLKWLTPLAVLAIAMVLTGCSGNAEAAVAAEQPVAQVAAVSATASPKPPTSTPMPEPTATEIVDPILRYIGPETDSEALAKAETGELGMLSIAWFHAEW